MESKGLTLSFIIDAQSANYGESIGNVSSLKKFTRFDGNQYTYISRQALRYNIVNQLGWDNTKVINNQVVQFHPEATIIDYPEIDLFGYMKTISKKDENTAGGSTIRSAVCRLSNAVSLTPFESDVDFLNNMGLSKRINENNALAQSEIHDSLYTYTVTIDLDSVGIDNDLEIPNTEKAKRVKDLLKTLQYLYRDIRGRREKLSPIFVIGGIYDRKNPFFENSLKLKKDKLNVELIKSVLCDEEISKNTKVGYIKGFFENDSEIIEELNTKEISNFFNDLGTQVDEFYK